MERALCFEEVVARLERELADHHRSVEAFAAAVTRLGAEIPDLRFDGSRWVSSVTERMSDVSLEIVRAGCEHRHDDPAAVYARPRHSVMGESIDFERDYLVATVSRGAVHVEPGWPMAMRADGLPERVIHACRRLLSGLAPS